MSLSNNVSKKLKVCEECNSSFTPVSNRQKICRECNPYTKKKPSEKERLRTFNLSLSKEASGWKSGIGVYRLIGKKDECSKCGSDRFLVVHHKDEDRNNNSPDNLECICRKCHQIEHKFWENLPRGEDLSKIKKLQASKAKRDKFGRFIKSSPKV